MLEKQHLEDSDRMTAWIELPFVPQSEKPRISIPSLNPASGIQFK
jgi:hypothetical protein